MTCPAAEPAAHRPASDGCVSPAAWLFLAAVPALAERSGPPPVPAPA